MTPLHVDLGSRSYPIYIDSGIISNASLYQKHIRGNNVLIVCDDNTARHYLPAMEALLSEYHCASVTLPAGEQHKTLDTVNRIYDVLMENRFDRNSTLIALGGGVVGDICGFAAATFQRGVNFIQVPTTLLAQVDSSVGGKTGVNHALGKNMIGAFHQPACVIADMDTLHSLPDRELRAGLAEVIKYGLIDDAEFYHWVDQHLPDLLAFNGDKLAFTVTRCCANKARIVAADEREAGQRALLNLGHTFGHAIETASGYGNWLHGEAIAAGMCMAARFSADSGHLTEDVVNSIANTFERTGLPTTPPAHMTSEQFIELMYRDKKVRDNVLTLVLMNDVGASFLSSTFDPELLRKTLYQTLNK
ncbi:MAG: 3-dehydroquinate synthase [Pseudomonadota bacterium]